MRLTDSLFKSEKKVITSLLGPSENYEDIQALKSRWEGMVMMIKLPKQRPLGTATLPFQIYSTFSLCSIFPHLFSTKDGCLFLL